MKNTFFDDPAVLRKYLFMALGEYSDHETQKAEKRWLEEKVPDNAELQSIALMMYNFPRPLTLDRFRYILETLELK